MNKIASNYHLRGTLGVYDLLRNIIWILYDTDDVNLNPQLLAFNHEYNHLIGIAGRHLQICLLEFYLTENDQFKEIIANEKSIVESFVPIWLSTPNRLGSSIKLSEVAPECEEDLVRQLKQLCIDLKTCNWITNGKMIKPSLEEIVRAVQQAVLNVAQEGSLYSPGSSMTAIKCLMGVSKSIKGKNLAINRIQKGEYYVLEYGLIDTLPVGYSSADTDNFIPGDLLECFLSVIIQKESGLEPRRYTLHERTEFVLKWLCKLISHNYPRDQIAEIFAGITSVFMPRVFVPVTGFWQESHQRYKGEVHALPFAYRPISMPILTRHIGNRIQETSILPFHILELQRIPDEIRHQSACTLGHAMGDFCEFALGEITSSDFRERSNAVFSNLGSSLERIVLSLETSRCNMCVKIKENIGDKYCQTLLENVKSLCKTVGEYYTIWICNYMENEFKNSDWYIASEKMPFVQVSSKGNNAYKYL